MSLRDKACYALTLVPSLADPRVLELIEGHTLAARGEARYARVREERQGEVYSAAFYAAVKNLSPYVPDALSGARLASAGYVSDKIKSRRLELHGPDVPVPFEFTGRLGFEWTLTFESNAYRWKRDFGVGRDYICSLDRKPDPPVEVCLARGPDKSGPGQIQILHYNIERFLGTDIHDLRGLEMLLAASLVCLLDAADDRANAMAASSARPSLAASAASSSDSKSQERIEERYVEDANEVVVGVHTDLDMHVARAVGLLEDPTVLFIVIRTRTSAAAQRALEVLLGVTRFRHHESLPELHQYVVEEDDADPPPPVPRGPKVIDLNDAPAAALTPSAGFAKRAEAWTPPKNLAIYLSTIELPDLKPRAGGGNDNRVAAANGQSGGPSTAGAFKSGSGGDGPSRTGSASPGDAGGSEGRKVPSLHKLFKPTWSK